MTSGRLPFLLLALASLAGLRVSFPPPSKGDPVVQALVRPAPAATAVPASPLPAIGEEASTESTLDPAGNAFSVRTVAIDPPARSIAAAPRRVAAMAPLPQAPAHVAVTEPMPPLQVVGTYDDGRTTAVFIATPTGIRIARPGTLLIPEYRVAAIAPGHVTLTRVSSQRSFDLPLPAGRP